MATKIELERFPVEVQRKIRVYGKVAQNPRHARILGRLQGLGGYSGDQLQVHYRNNSETLQKGYRQLLTRRA